MRHSLLGNYPLIAFARALDEYKSDHSFQMIILYAKKMLEEMFLLIKDDRGGEQLYSETMGMEDFIGQTFKLKAKN